MVSVIVPIYNAEKYIEKCILSILNQTYFDFELILIDDGSTDQSYNISKKYAEMDRRIVFYHQKNCGVSYARNVGIQLSTGEYVMFVDADDRLEKNAIEIAMNTLIRENADLVIYGWKIVNEKDLTIKNCIMKPEQSQDILGVLHKMLEHYSAYGGGYPWNKIWKKEVIISNNNEFPKFDTSLYYFEDLEWVVRMLFRIHKVVVCPECLYSYYIHQDSVTHSKGGNERREIGYHQSIQKVINNLSEFPTLKKWFEEKYYPEIVNGLIHAKRNKWKDLWEYLYEKMNSEKIHILEAKTVPINIKIRCVIMSIIGQFHL